MAKATTRRRKRRAKKGRRRKASGRVYRRRTRRNAPAASNPKPRRRRRASGTRRKRRRTRRNDWPGQPRRHARAARLGHRRRRRRYRRNPSGSSGRVYRRRYRLMDNPVNVLMDTFKEAFSGETMETVFHTGLGFGGTLVGSRLIYKQLWTALGATPLGRVGTTAVTGIVSSALLGMIGGKNLGVRALAGGMLATLWAGLSEAVRDTQAADWIPTLGEGESEEFRKQIEQEVLKELRGGGMSHAGEDGAEYDEEGMSYYLQPAGSQEYLQPAGSEAYLTSQEAEEAEERPAGNMAYLTSREVVAAEAGVGDAEFGPAGMPERF